MFNNSKWITYPKRLSSVTFKKSFVCQKTIKKATLYITSVGFYHCFINDKRIDKDFFSPGWTECDARVQFQKYNITKLIKDKNDFKVDLGEGWTGGDHFAWTKPGTFLYHQMSLRFEIEIEYENSKKEYIVSDENIDVFSNTIIESTIYGGERQDAFAKVEYLGKAKLIDLDIDIIPQEGEHIITGERFKAKKMFYDTARNLVIDFGQNITGYIEVNIKGKKGDVITYTSAEILDKNGVFYNENYRTAKSIYSFVLSGKQDKFVPNFSFLGGRYIKLIDYPKYIKKENFEAVMVHSKLKRTGEFVCGHQKLNRLYKNIIYGQLGNYLDVPTDCPQRDERLGWTADAQVFSATGAINFDVKKFLKKYLNDMVICQHDDGSINGVIPFSLPGRERNRLISTGWADACCIIPFELYQAYGDKNIIKRYLPMMEKWVNYLLDHCDKPYIPNLPFSWGDWLALDKKFGQDHQGMTRYDMIATAYLYKDLEIISSFYQTLGKDSTHFLSLKNKVQEAYQTAFIKDGHMIGKKMLMYEDENQERSCYTQTGIAMTLYFNLAKKEDKKTLTNDLINLIKECDNKMNTGFLGTPCLLEALSQNNQLEEAYRLLLTEQFPSWLFSVNMGATTMWEHWDGINENGDVWPKEMNSFNHYAYGAVYKWMFNHILGIQVIKPGYKEILIEPIPNEKIGFAKGSYISKYGKISVMWKLENKKLHYHIVVPKGIKTTIKIDHQTFISNGGVYKN